MTPSSDAPVPAGVATLYEQGRAANGALRPAAAERLLRRALDALATGRAAGAPGRGADGEEPFPSYGRGPASALEAWVRVQLSLSTAVTQRRGPAVALPLARAALAAAEDASTEDVRRALRALCRSQLSYLHSRAGHPRPALAELDLAVVDLDSLGPLERFNVINNRGYLRLDLPDVEGAAADFAAAAELAASHDLPRQEFMARHHLGLVAFAEGDLPGALRLMLEADRLPADISRAPAWHGRALVLLEAGLVEEGVELLRRSVSAASSEGQRLQAGETLVDLAQGQLLLGDHEAALASATRAARALGRADAPGMRRRAVLVQLTARLLTGSAPGRVAGRGRALAAQFDEDGDHVAGDLARLLSAEALSRAGRHAEATEALASCVADVARTGSLSTRMRARVVAGEAARAGGDASGARRHVGVALRDLTAALQGSASLELRAVLATQARDLATLDLDLAGDRPSRRLAAVERWHDVATRSPAVRPPADPEQAHRVTLLRQLEQQLRDEPERAGEIEDRIRTLERQVATASWASGGRAVAARGAAVPLPRVRDELAARGAAAVSFVEHRQHLCAAVLSGGRTRWVHLGPVRDVHELVARLSADLEGRVRVAAGPMGEVVEASLRRSAAALDEHVLAPLGVDGRLVVVPSPTLAPVPWGVLPSRGGRPTTVTPSLGAWVRGAGGVPRPTVAALAGPRLPLALEEGTSVASAWAAAGPRGLASSADVEDALASSDVVHVAAHGTHRSDGPLFSSLWLQDGPLYLADLERVARVASHVVVSACDAGRTRARGGSASLGLASGLLSLGVGSVVASPCRVPDPTAADVMARYHRALAAGQEVDEALAGAAHGSGEPLAGAFVAWGSPWSVRSPG